LKPTRILQVLVSAGLLALLVRWIDLGAFRRAVASADPALLGVALLLAVADRVLMAIKWNLLLAAKRIRLRWTEAVRLYWNATFLGLFLPATVGADVVRAVVLSRSESRRADVVSSILVERFLGLVALAVFGFGGAVLAPAVLGGGAVDRARLLVIAGGAALAIVAALGFSFTPACERLVDAVSARAAGRRGVGRPAEVLAKVYRSFRGYREHRGVLAAFFALSLVENLLPVARALCVGRALHVNVPALFFVAIVPIELLLIRLPVTVDGFGLREGVFTFFLAKMGVPQSLGFAVGLVNHVLFLLAVMPGGVIHLLGSADQGRASRRDGGEGAPADVRSR
jgi:uncharacterized protein (TIRG00374 family)